MTFCVSFQANLDILCTAVISLQSVQCCWYCSLSRLFMSWEDATVCTYIDLLWRCTTVRVLTLLRRCYSSVYVLTPLCRCYGTVHTLTMLLRCCSTCIGPAEEVLQPKSYNKSSDPARSATVRYWPYCADATVQHVLTLLSRLDNTLL